MTAVSTDCKLAIFTCEKLLNFSEDLEELKADRVVKSKVRMTCVAINNLSELKPIKRKREQVSDVEDSEEIEKPIKKKVKK